MLLAALGSKNFGPPVNVLKVSEADGLHNRAFVHIQLAFNWHSTSLIIMIFCASNTLKGRNSHWLYHTFSLNMQLSLEL